MSIRNILVAYDGTERANKAFRLAASIALRRDAHLTGLFARTTVSVHPYIDLYGAHEALATLAVVEKDADAKVEKAFEAAAAAEGVTRVSFHTATGYPEDVLADWARTYDLVVMATADPESGDMALEASPDRVALRAGRPVLVAPQAFDPEKLLRGAVVAWDGKRAAARALSDAMDLIEAEDQITVLHVGQEAEVRQPGRDVMEHLSRHGAKAALTVKSRGSMHIGDIILNACADSGAGLLVMGAYEHSPLAEAVFGGVTRDIVAHTHIPVLMSH